MLGLIVALGVLFVLENGVRGSLRKLIFFGTVMTFLIVLGVVMSKMQKVVGERLAVAFGGVVVVAVVVAFVLWLAASWGG